jgi:hypothetical protein
MALVAALPAAASDTGAAKSITIRVYVKEVTQSIKDVPPKTMNLGEHTKGDTIRGTEILRNAARQFNKPKGAQVGTDRYVEITLAQQKATVDFVTTFPGGTLHAHQGTHKIGSKPEVPIVGGTELYAGATGSIEGQHLANGEKLNIYRLQIP